MDFYKHLKEYDKAVTEMLKKHATGLFYESPVPILREQVFGLDSLPEQAWEKFFSTNEYDYFHSAYLELTKYIYSDYYYQEYLAVALNDGSDIPLNIQKTDQIKDIERYEDDFYAAFELLTSNWIKYYNFSSETDFPTFSWDIFKILYSKYPILCRDAFPAVLFVLADSYYDFCKICYEYKGHQIISKQKLQQRSEQILSLFYNRISGNNWNCYFFSLIDTKPTYYSESSFSEGEENYNALMQTTETARRNAYDPYDHTFGYESIEKAVYKEYRKRLKRKNDDRAKKIEHASAIAPGENFQALWKFLHTFTSDNKWSHYNQAFTLYTLNNMSGWLNVLLLQNKKMDRTLFHYYLTPALPATLYFITNSLLNCPYGELKDNMKKNSIPPNIILKNMYERIKDIDDSDGFIKWGKSATEKELSQLQFESEKVYKNIYENLKSNSQINLNVLVSFLVCYMISFTSVEEAYGNFFDTP